MRREAAIEVGRAALEQLRREVGRRGGARARPIRQLGALGQSEVGAPLGEPGRQEIHELRPGGHELDALTSELSVPRSERFGICRAGPDPSEESVALRQYARVGQSCLRPRRPEGGDHLVEVATASRWGTLDELETLGQEDADQRPY